MNRCPAIFACLFTLLIGLSTPRCLAQTPAPKPATFFLMPLADGSIATTVILPTTDEQAYLVYASPTGQIGLYLLTPASLIPPLDPPIPPTPPVPPPKPPQKLASVITITETEPAPIGAEVDRAIRSANATYFAYTIEMVSMPNPPANSLKWIGLSAGRSYPYTFAATAAGVILWQGPTPTTAADFLAMLGNLQPSLAAADRCSGGSCPVPRRNR